MILIDILSPVSAAAAVIVILLTLIYYFMKKRDILPGPRGLPYFGLYPVLTDERCHLQLQEIGKKYGDLYSFVYLGKLIINMGSPKALREVHVNKSDSFAGRFTDFNILTYLLEDGVAMVNGESWKAQRKFFIQSFKEYGLSTMKNDTATPLYDSLTQVLEDFHAQKGKPFNVIEVLTERCMATMRKILFGEDGVSDEDLRNMIAAYTVTLDSMTGVKLMIVGPLGKFLFRTHPGLRKALEQHKVMKTLLKETVRNIEASMDERVITCVVEDFYMERNIRRRKNDPTWKYFSEKALVSSLSQIVGDGILAVAYFIGCFLYALIEHPDEQEKIYKELMEVVGPNRLPTIEDKSKLPYTTAFINEVIRTSNFFPLFPSMACTKETTIRGYRIPKGSITLINIWQAHHDPETYENPEKFDPCRFIASPGKPRAELPVQFGMGKRSCTGEPFVMTQAFLYLTSVVKTFTISEASNPSSKSEMFLMTGNMELCLHPRTEK